MALKVEMERNYCRNVFPKELLQWSRDLSAASPSLSRLHQVSNAYVHERPLRN